MISSFGKGSKTVQIKYLPPVAEVDAADEGVELVDDHQLLVVRPQERVHVRPAVRVPEHLQGIYSIL